MKTNQRNWPLTIVLVAALICIAYVAGGCRVETEPPPSGGGATLSPAEKGVCIPGQCWGPPPKCDPKRTDCEVIQ